MLKHLRIALTTRLMFVLVATATLLRFIFIYFNWPATNSDEGTMDLMALHIAYRGEHPIFFYGQDYMGSLQAYAGALLMHLFSPSVLTVRLGTLLIFALYLCVMYYLTAQLYSKKFALLIITFYTIGSGQVIETPLLANGGYAETMLFAALIFLLTFRLALTARPPRASGRHYIYATLGVVMGLALWSDQLILPCIMTAGLLLLIFTWREMLTWSGLTFLGGLLVGAIPLLIYSIHTTPDRDILHVLVGNAGFTGQRAISFLQQIAQVVLIALPTQTGYSALCPVREPYHPVGNLADLFVAPNAWTCVAGQGAWSLTLIILWSYAASSALLHIRRQWQSRRTMPGENWPFAERQALVRQVARLMLLMSAALWFLLFTLSAAAAESPRGSARYLLCLLLATPAIAWPLWKVLSRTGQPVSSKTQAICYKGIASMLLCIFCAMALQGTIAIISSLPATRAEYNRQQTFIDDLLKVRATRIYTEYWTCNRLAFQSNERIICSNLDEQLRPARDRYQPYRDIVRADQHPAYVFPLHSRYALTLDKRKNALAKQYRRIVLEGYLVYYFP